MKEVVKKMVDHPFATMIAVGAVGSAVADIIRAIRGVPATPGFAFNVTTDKN